MELRAGALTPCLSCPLILVWHHLLVIQGKASPDVSSPEPTGVPSLSPRSGPSFWVLLGLCTPSPPECSVLLPAGKLFSSLRSQPGGNSSGGLPGHLPQSDLTATSSLVLVTTRLCFHVGVCPFPPLEGGVCFRTPPTAAGVSADHELGAPTAHRPSAPGAHDLHVVGLSPGSYLGRHARLLFGDEVYPLPASTQLSSARKSGSG